MKTTRSTSIAIVLFVLLVSACGKDNKVGDDSLLNFKDQAQKERLGETTTTAPQASTTAPPTTAAAAGGKGALRNTTTTAAAAATTTTAVVAFEIAINSDGGGTQFAPPSAQVYVNTLVRWTNKDTVARSVESDDGSSFRSPSIPPGGTFTYRATKTGRFNYHDGTRPYAVASLEVTPR